MLNISPKLIINANIFTRNSLLVTGLIKYPCSKALIVEDMHDVNNLNRLIKMNGINNILYHCNCNQLDKLQMINFNRNFHHYPHFIDLNIFRDYNLPKKYDIILYGCAYPNVYPFRARLFRLINNCKMFKKLYISFPGYDIRKKKNAIMGEKLAKLINQSWIGIVTPSATNYFLKKYLEIPACNCMIAGNLPTRDAGLIRGNTIELSPSMTDNQIITIIANALKNKEELRMRTKSLKEIIDRNYGFESGYNNFKKIIGKSIV